MEIFKSAIVWIIGLGFMIILFPLSFLIWLLVLPFDSNRTVIHWLLVHQSAVLSGLIPIWKITIEGREKALDNTTYVIISNHQSLLDILIINCLTYKYKWISKVELLNVPVLSWYLKMADYIIIDRNNDESKAAMLEESYKCLKQGTSIMIFPEGTRSRNNEIGFFKRGAFQLALQANVPILPVLIDGTGGILPRHGLVFNSGCKIRIRVLDPVLPGSFGTSSPEDLARKFSLAMTSELKELRNNTGTR
jgi:1-acyl-sn-glycerol-3-phosphate acyltransferase